LTRRQRFDSLAWPVAAVVAAFGFLVLGVVVWHKWGPGPGGTACDASRCFQFRPSHREHPLRAEAIWTASALLALIGLFWAARILVGRRGVARPDGLGRA